MNCSFNRNMMDVFGLVDACVFVCILYTYFSGVPVYVLEQCLCNLFQGVSVCKCACAALRQMPFSVYAMGCMSLVRVSRKGDHWRATETISGPEKVEIFSSCLWEERNPWQEKNNKDQLLFYVIPLSFHL